MRTQLLSSRRNLAWLVLLPVSAVAAWSASATAAPEKQSLPGVDLLQRFQSSYATTSMADKGTVETLLCISPVLHDAAGAPKLVVHLEHELNGPEGEIARLHVHRVVDALQSEPLDSRLSIGDTSYTLVTSPLGARPWVEVEDIAQADIQVRVE